jgi:hypothetical protein
VRRVLLAERDDVVPVFDGRDDLDLRAKAEQELERLAEHLVVLDQGDANDV